MYKDDLFKLLETEEVKNNPELHTELYKVWNNIYSEVDIRELSINACEYLLDNGLDPSKALSSVLNGGYSYSDPISKEVLHQIELVKFLIEKGATFKDVYSIPSSFPYETYQYLLEHGMDPAYLLRKLGDIEPGERHDQILELILSKDIDWNKISVSYSISLADLEKFLELGLDSSKALSSVLNGGYSYSDPISKEVLHQIELVKFLIEKGATFKYVYTIPSSFTYETYQYLLEHGMDPAYLLRKLGDIEPRERHDQILELVLSKDIDWNNISVSYSTSLSDLEKFLELGLDSSKALSSVLNGGYSYSDPISKEVLHQIELAKFLIEKGATFKDVYWIPNSFPYETYQYLLDHGMDPSCLIRKLGDISGERHDQVLELILSKDIDWNKISVSSSISLADLEKFLELGLDSSKALSSVLNGGYSYSDPISKEVLHQIELAKFLIEKGATFKDVYSIPSYFPYETYQYLLEHGLNANHILSKVFEIELGERHDQLLDLALIHKANLSKTWSIGNNISKVDLDKIIDSGLNPTKILELLSNDRFIEFFDYLTEKGIDLSALKKIPSDLSYEQYQEVLKKGVNPDILLLSAGSLLQRNDNEETKEKALKIIKLALDNGADINADYGNGNLLSATMDHEILDFLIERGAKCSDRSLDEITENGLTNILFNPQITIDQKFKNLDAEKSEEAKIPYILHQIWLTSPESPREIREQDLKISLETHETFSKAPVQWQQIVWTNDKNLFPKTVKILEDNGIQVKSIYEHQDELSSFEMIENLIAQQKWGMASDALRYVLVNEFGGVYADLNFNFNRHTTDEAHKYNYFTQEFGSYYIDNFFFGASPNHPIIQKIVEMVERNIVNPPKYIANIKDQTSPIITDMATANPTFIAYYLEANKDDNIDVVYPKGAYPRGDNFYEPISSELMNFEETKETISKYCPDFMWMYDLGNHQNPFNNVCVVERFIIGEDSTDGRTWVSE